MTDAAKRRLLDRLRADASRTGRVRRLLATTHNLDADFFDGDFLCTALSIAQADFAGQSGQLALQRKLAGLDYSGVLCEARAYEERPSLRTVVHAVSLRGACLHAKLVVIEYEHAVRLLVGSANLTSKGYRHNREVLGEHLAHEDEPKLASQAAAVLRSAREVLGTFSPRAPEFLHHLDVVRERLERWAGSAAAEASPVVWSDGERPLWRALLERWPDGARVERVRIVSPFWSEDGSRDTPLRRLLSELRERGALGARCHVELWVESAPLAAGGYEPKEQPAIYFADFPGVSIQVIPVDPRVLPSDLEMKVDLTEARVLHAKLLVLESRDRALAYAGSANFTRNGFGFRGSRSGNGVGLANLEAGWMFELAPAAVTGLLSPAANDGRPLASLPQPGSHPDEDPDDLEARRFWPEPLLSAELTPAAEGDVLELTTVWAAATPQGWTVHAVTGDEDAELGAPRSTTAGAAATVVTALLPDVLKLILRERQLVIATPERARARVPVNVAAGDARHRLPLSPAGKRPSEEDLLLYYQGRITFDDLYPPVEGLGEQEAEAKENARPGSSVDKNRIQAYQIRAFVDALPGIKRELLALRGSDGVLYQAFCGEVSPVALAQHVVEQVASGRRTATAGAFQLAELGALLRAVAAQAPADVEHYTVRCECARREVEVMLEKLRGHHSELNDKSAFARYAATLAESRG